MPTSMNASVLACAVAVFIVLGVLGSLANPTQGRFAAADPVVGFGLATGVLTALGTLTPLPLSIAGALLALLALAGAAWDPRRATTAGGPGAILAALALSPLLVAMAGMSPVNWDEFMHWLPNAAWLHRYDAFPMGGAVAEVSERPAYPYALPLAMHLASTLTGRFVESTGGLFNLLFLASFGPVLAGVAATAMSLPASRLRWLAPAGALVAVLLGPGADPDFTMTALADTTTAVALGVTGVLGWQALEARNAGDEAATWVLAWRSGLAAVALLGLRQPNPELLALLVGALGISALSIPALRRWSTAALLMPLLGPPLLFLVLWRLHVARHLSRGEFPLAGPAHWHLHLIDETVLAIAGRMVEHPGSYLLLAVVAVSGLRALRSSADGPDRLALIAGLVWLGHTLFLVCAYLTVFEPWEAETAAEFWRYSTQTGLLGMAAAAALLVRAAKRLPVLPRWQVFGIGVLLTALLAEPDTRRILPQVRADLPILEMIGRELAETLPEGARIAVLRPRADALAFFVVRYRLWRPGRDDRDLRAVRETHEPPVDPDNDLAWLRNSLADHNVSHILVEAPTSAYADALGITESADGLFLLEKGWEQWSIAKRWPEIR